MPVTPYHFGPSGFVGLLLRRWLDVPVFIAANILIDIEVIADNVFQHGWPVHQLWHFHTLLVGGLAGLFFGLAVYFISPFRWLSEKTMTLIGLSGKASWISMGLAGLLGAWFHVFIDSFYHYDVQILWPYQENVVFRWINQGEISNVSATQRQVVFWCLAGTGLMIVTYLISLVGKYVEKQAKSTQGSIKNDKFVNDNP